jgi:hypothetical protein
VCYEDDEIKEDKMCGAYSAHGGIRKCIQNFGRKTHKTQVQTVR